MIGSVTAIIPTVGRSSLARAIASVLDQTHPVDEIIVVADTDQPVVTPTDSRIAILHTPAAGGGPAKARQFGIDNASGTVVAMLDDDDQWCANKLEFQLHAAGQATTDRWIISSRIDVRGPGEAHRVWPRRLINQNQPIADYLFRFTDLSVGGAVLQSSTLCFPTALGRQVRWDAHGAAIHDEPTWLLAVQNTFPDIQIIQLPETLSVYHVGATSVSRQPSDLTNAYIQWGLDHLQNESPRILGDYLCTNPVSAAVSAHSLRGVGQALHAAIRRGRPGPYAVGYAVLNAGRIMADSLRSRAR